MSEKKNELNEKDLENVTGGGLFDGRERYDKCPYCKQVYKSAESLIFSDRYELGIAIVCPKCHTLLTGNLK